MGPAAIAGSTPMREKKRGEKTPSAVPAMQPPMRPAVTIVATAKGEPEATVLPTRKSRA